MVMRAIRANKEEREQKCCLLLAKCRGWESDAGADMGAILRELAKIYHNAHEAVLLEEQKVCPAPTAEMEVCGHDQNFTQHSTRILLDGYAHPSRNPYCQACSHGLSERSVKAAGRDTSLGPMLANASKRKESACTSGPVILGMSAVVHLLHCEDKASPRATPSIVNLSTGTMTSSNPLTIQYFSPSVRAPVSGKCFKHPLISSEFQPSMHFHHK
eukprot:6478225-Amphidinium_carterae.1